METGMNRSGLKIGDLEAIIPVIQGGMGVGISLSGLAGAVAKAGGIGIISTAQIGYRSSEFDKNPIETNLKAIGEEVKKARAIAPDGIIGVNIMVATREYDRYVKAAVEAGVDLIVSGAGLPTDLPAYVKGSRTKIAPIVSTEKSASVILKFWDRHFGRVPDLLVIEGPRAGGHLGFSMEQLEQFSVPKYEEEIKKIIEKVGKYEEQYNTHIPVVVGGGIYTREDMQRMLSLGADGVQMGTRFVTTYECDAPDAYKMAYINAKKEEIQLVKSPVGMPGRAIWNSFLERTKVSPQAPLVCHKCIRTCNPATIPYCITDALTAAARGRVEDGLLFCGSNAYKATKLEHVSDILSEFDRKERINR